MSERGTSFVKVLAAILFAFVLIGGCAVGGCFVMMHGCAKGVSTSLEQTKAAENAYLQKMSVRVGEPTLLLGNTVVEGAVSNNGDRTVSFWKVTVRFVDASGTVIDTDSTTSVFTDLKPGDTTKWKIMRSSDLTRSRAQAEIERITLK